MLIEYSTSGVVVTEREFETYVPEVVLGPEEYTMEDYLASEEYESLVQTRIRLEVLEKFPHIYFDTDDMEAIANTKEDVREKFDRLRSLNTELEDLRKARAITPARGRNNHISDLLSFMLAYNYILRKDKTGLEYQLIKNLADILNKEYGNMESLVDVPRVFMEGVGKGASAIVSGITEGAKTIIGGVAEGIFGEDWKSKIIIAIVIIVAIIIFVGIGYFYVKSYVGAKATKRAIT